MPKHTFRVSGSAADASLGSGFYTGEKPPVGVYNVILKRLRLKVNKNGDDMLNPLCEIQESDERKQYNGYGIWSNLNVTDEGAPYVNNFLEAIGVSPKAFYSEGGVVIDNEDPPNITKIGTKRTDIPIKFRVSTRDDTYNNNTKLNVTRFMPAEDAELDLDDEMDDEVELIPDVPQTPFPEQVDAGVLEDAVSDEELEEMDLDDLTALAEEWGWVKGRGRTTEKTLRKWLHDYQVQAEEEAAIEEEEEVAAEAEEELGGYEEADLMTRPIADLKAILTDEFSGTVPKPPIRARIVKAILDAQDALLGEGNPADPPF